MGIISNDAVTILIFRIDDINYAINIDYVVMVMEAKEIIKIPNMPDYIGGFIQTNDLAFPIINGKLNINLSTNKFFKNSNILVLRSDWNEPISYIGIMVVDFSDVLTINKNEIKDFPSLGKIYKPLFIEGVIEKDKKLILLLNHLNILTGEEKVEIRKIFNDILRN